ncbi:hypothetical protein IVB22_00995 [Bradyrhizobium sp. 190]|uniref:hypothetical protein n=1 Tax=Bradyrhizobium sp. 190 TaxID=2782658 RepID=UPI001FFA0B52|nr:hypothetical protein [Bradyrhizobium sp. 190]MCK1511168.1 hypothetical protein [Bradyrhizobium sp. 190]
MLRWMMPFLVAIFAVGTAAADESLGAAKAADDPTAVKPADPPAAAKPAENPAATKRTEKTAAGRRAAVRAVRQLPPGLPRDHYNYRTTVAPPAAPLYVRRGRTLVLEEEVLVPTGIKAYAPRVFGTPLLPGSSTLPGYYGTSHSYSYDGPYYGGPYEPYWNRLPYACGVYGYC